MTRDKRDKRVKLGLALAGGGFRASLFHLGVLRRMAELDLLRYVQILSTVSGGSIVGAHYILLLKRKLEASGLKSAGPEMLRLPPEDYEEIVNELHDGLIGGIKKNLRTRLLMNPWTLFKAVYLREGLTSMMGLLYEKHIFASAKPPDLDPKAGSRPSSIPLEAIRLRKDQVEDKKIGGTEQYNFIALDQDRDKDRGGPGSAVTRLVLNATSLNSGSRFEFSATEIGDWYLGHIRRDEIRSELLPRKILLDLAPSKRQELLDAWPINMDRWKSVAGDALDHWGVKWNGKKARDLWDSEKASSLREWINDGKHMAQVKFIHWWVRIKRERDVPESKLARLLNVRNEDKAAVAELPLPWHGDALEASEFLAFVRVLLKAEAGRLRDAKNHAWYLAKGRYRYPRVTAGMCDETLWALFWDALKSIDYERALMMENSFRITKAATGAEPQWCKQLFDWVFEVYYCRTAAAISPNIEAEWDALTLADAVAASAAFPPAFPPYQLRDLYDDTHVQVLSLTDGGPFDNIGVTALLDEHCNYVIASDTGAIFDNRQSKAAVGRIGMMGRLSEMLMNRPAQLYRHDLNERRRLGDAVEAGSSESRLSSAVSQFVASREIKGLASFHIGSERLTEDAPPSVDPDLIAHLRTDLDVFGDVEIKCLVNEGYIIADQYLRTGLKDSPFDPFIRTQEASSWAPAQSVPFPMNLEDDHVERILRVGRHRFFRALMLWAPLSTVVTLGAATVLVYAVWINNWEWLHVYDAINKLINWVVTTKWLASGFIIEIFQLIPLKYVAAIALPLLVAWLAFREVFTKKVLPTAKYKLLREFAGFWRKFLTLWKNVKSFKGLLWGLLLSSPLITIFGVTAVAWVSHYFFAKPFQRKTRNPEGLDRPKRNADPG